MHQSACGVSAKQCALGTLQDFHPIDIKDREGLRLRDGDIALIQIHRIGRLDDVIEVVLGHSANGELCVLSGEVA